MNLRKFCRFCHKSRHFQPFGDSYLIYAKLLNEISVSRRIKYTKYMHKRSLKQLNLSTEKESNFLNVKSVCVLTGREHYTTLEFCRFRCCFQRRIKLVKRNYIKNGNTHTTLKTVLHPATKYYRNCPCTLQRYDAKFC